MSIINCSTCQSQGKTNRCYVTGYSTKCEHDNGWALTTQKSGNKIMTCKCCPGNNLYITGYDIKCGHDNGYAYTQEQPKTAKCASCSKDLSGYWSMESNLSNSSYQDCPNGRYLGVNGNFLYGTNTNWVYSYCTDCWKKEIIKILPTLGISDKSKDVTDLSNKVSTMQNEINSYKSQITQLKNNESNLNNQISSLKNVISYLKQNETNLKK